MGAFAPQTSHPLPLYWKKSRLIEHARLLRPSLLTTGSVLKPRYYHSYDHSEPDPFMDSESPKYKILTKALDEFVPELGFQHKAILESSRTFGYSDAIQSLFHNGTYDLIKFHLVRERLNLKKHTEDPSFATMSENDKLKFLTSKRLMGNAPVAKHLTELQTYLVLPPNFAESSNELHNLSDELRFLSGDSSNDFAWYSKRLALSTTYVGLELFQAGDKSPDFIKTLELCEKKLDQLNGLGSGYTDVGEWLEYTVHSGINLIKSQVSRG